MFIERPIEQFSISDVLSCPSDTLIFFISFLYLGFLSRKFMIHMTAGGGEGYFSKSSFSLHPLYRHLDISRMINAESSPLHITSSRTRTKLRDHQTRETRLSITHGNKTGTTPTLCKTTNKYQMVHSHFDYILNYYLSSQHYF